MNYGVPNQPKASHLRTNQNQKAAEGNARRLAHNYSSQIVNPSFGATNPAKYVNGHFSYSQQDNSSTALAAPARVHNIPIQVSSRFLHQQAYRGGTPPSTAQYLPLSNRSPSSTMRYYPTGREQPGREFQSRIPMARQYFGNMSLTNRNRIEQSASHFRRGSAPGSAEYEGQPGEEYLPMSYNLRHTTPERNEPQLVASYYHPPPTSNLSSASFSRRDAANHQLPSSSRLTHQERAEEEEEATREQKASSATSTIASSIHSEAIIHPDQQVVAETDILYSSSDEEDDVVRGCAQEDDLHQRLATNDMESHKLVDGHKLCKSLELLNWSHFKARRKEGKIESIIWELPLSVHVAQEIRRRRRALPFVFTPKDWPSGLLNKPLFGSE